MRNRLDPDGRTMSDRKRNSAASTDSAELIRLAQAGSDDAFAELAVRYRKLIFWHLHRCGVSEGSEQDDYMQEALIGLLRAVRTYDETGSSFTTYASSCIHNALVSAQRKELKRAGRTLVQWETMAEDLPSGESPESALIDRESSSILYNKIFSVLSGYEQEVFGCFLANMSYAQTASLLGRDEKSVANAVCRIRKKLRSVLKG